MKKVVVTGLGIMCPIGNHLEEAWQNALAGKSGIGRLSAFVPPEHCVTIAGEVKGFEPSAFMPEKDVKRSQRFVHLAVAAAKMALSHARLEIDPSIAEHVGVSIGVGIGALGYLEEQSEIGRTRGVRRVSPFTIPGFIGNMAAGIVSMETGAKGPNNCNATACSSAGHSLADALMYIQTGHAKVMIAGGSESALSLLAYSGFGQMKALCSAHADQPQKASRPFDKNRSGFVMGEGAGILILEELEFAQQRGAPILCSFAGFGASGDAHHFTSPAPEGEGGARAMAQALRSSSMRPENIGYINAHGTSTELNDLCETQAIKRVFGTHAHALQVSSTKSMTGHLLGAAGGVEAVFSVLALTQGKIPPTINYETPDPLCDLNYTPNVSIEKPLQAVMSNSFGFGGTNISLIFSH